MFWGSTVDWIYYLLVMVIISWVCFWGSFVGLFQELFCVFWFCFPVWRTVKVLSDFAECTGYWFSIWWIIIKRTRDLLDLVKTYGCIKQVFEPRMMSWTWKIPSCQIIRLVWHLKTGKHILFDSNWPFVSSGQLTLDKKIDLVLKIVIDAMNTSFPSITNNWNFEFLNGI